MKGKAKALEKKIEGKKRKSENEKTKERKIERNP